MKRGVFLICADHDASGYRDGGQLDVSRITRRSFFLAATATAPPTAAPVNSPRAGSFAATVAAVPPPPWVLPGAGVAGGVPVAGLTGPSGARNSPRANQNLRANSRRPGSRCVGDALSARCHRRRRKNKAAPPIRSVPGAARLAHLRHKKSTAQQSGSNATRHIVPPGRSSPSDKRGLAA